MSIKLSAYEIALFWLLERLENMLKPVSMIADVETATIRKIIRVLSFKRPHLRVYYIGLSILQIQQNCQVRLNRNTIQDNLSTICDIYNRHYAW